jgi:hypothetical protein
MEITEFMLDAALRKATEAGLFSRHGTPYDNALNREIMRSILQAVAAAAQAERAEERALERWSVVRPMHRAHHPSGQG